VRELYATTKGAVSAQVGSDARRVRGADHPRRDLRTIGRDVGRERAPNATCSRTFPAMPPCIFCDIIAGRAAATIVAADAEHLAFMDLRQAHAGHVLVVPRAHIEDLRVATEAQAAALMRMVVRVSRAVGAAFPSGGQSVWFSSGEAANQEVPHLHAHVHPREMGDGLLEIYPAAPPMPDRETLERWGARIRADMGETHPANDATHRANPGDGPHDR
jgi:histidine triad (HIT) family protein